MTKRDMSKRAFWIFTFSVSIIFLILVLSSHVYAHDPARPDLDSWYMSLHSKNHVPCCDISDAHAVAAEDWKTEDGHYMVMIDGDWKNVPDEALIDAPNLAGKALVWFGYHSTRITCFMPGPMT